MMAYIELGIRLLAGSLGIAAVAVLLLLNSSSYKTKVAALGIAAAALLEAPALLDRVSRFFLPSFITDVVSLTQFRVPFLGIPFIQILQLGIIVFVALSLLGIIDVQLDFLNDIGQPSGSAEEDSSDSFGY